MLLHFVCASSFTNIDQDLDLIIMYPSDLLAYHVHTQLHPQVEAPLSLPSAHDDSAILIRWSPGQESQPVKLIRSWSSGFIL